MTKKTAGFTLVEVLVVTTLTSMLLLSSSALFVGFMSGNARNTARQKLKMEGNNILTQLEYLLRNSRRVEGCDGITHSTIQFVNLDGQTITVDTETVGSENRVKVSNGSDDYFLSAGDTFVENLNFTCHQPDSGKGQYVDVAFNLRKGDSDDSLSVEEEFSSGILIRNTSF